MQIFARRLTGQKIQLEVEVTDTITTLKTKIKDKVNIPPAKQVLLWNGSQLEDNQSLQECEISRKSTVDLIIVGTLMCSFVHKQGS